MDLFTALPISGRALSLEIHILNTQLMQIEAFSLLFKKFQAGPAMALPFLFCPKI